MIDEVFTICNVSQFYEEWLLDYGSSHNLCPHQYWFSTYQAIYGGSVLMGKNVSYKTMGLRVL
jgi:hypothetical protein